MVRVMRNMTQSEVACDDFRNSKSMSCSMYLSHSYIVSISVDSFVSNAISFFRLFLILCSAFQAEKRLIAIKIQAKEYKLMIDQNDYWLFKFQHVPKF